MQAEKGRDLDAALFGDNLAMPIFASAASHHPIVARDHPQAENLQSSTAGFAFRLVLSARVCLCKAGDVRGARLVSRDVFPEPLLPGPNTALGGTGLMHERIGADTVGTQKLDESLCLAVTTTVP